jgi:hypothetical protein
MASGACNATLYGSTTTGASCCPTTSTLVASPLSSDSFSVDTPSSCEASIEKNSFRVEFVSATSSSGPQASTNYTLNLIPNGNH